ncbi:MAG: response regulator [Cyanobacteria bacterium J06623_7]
MVDNDLDNLMFANYIIESMDMGFVEIQDSNKCLELVYKLLPDIVRAMAQDRELASISTIAVPGLTKPEDREKLIAADFDAYLSKPYLIEDLESKIYQLLKCPLV